MTTIHRNNETRQHDIGRSGFMADDKTARASVSSESVRHDDRAISDTLDDSIEASSILPAVSIDSV